MTEKWSFRTALSGSYGVVFICGNFIFEK